MRAAAGTMFPATTTSPTSVRRAQVCSGCFPPPPPALPPASHSSIVSSEFTSAGATPALFSLFTCESTRSSAGAQGSQSGSRCSSAGQPLLPCTSWRLPPARWGPCSCAPGQGLQRLLPWWWEEVWPSGNTEGTAGILCRSLWSHSAGERSAWWAHRGYKTPAAFFWLNPPPPTPAPLQQSG